MVKKYPEIEIRAALEDDLDDIRQLYRETIVSVNRLHYTDTEVSVWSSASEDKAAWKKKFYEEHFYLAVLKGTAVGFASITDEGYIDYMFVHKDYQRRGIASALLATVEAAARERNVPCVWAEVSITARPFFGRMGFVITEKFEKEYKGVAFDDCIMTKYYR